MGTGLKMKDISLKVVISLEKKILRKSRLQELKGMRVKNVLRKGIVWGEELVFVWELVQGALFFCLLSTIVSCELINHRIRRRV